MAYFQNFSILFGVPVLLAIAIKLYFSYREAKDETIRHFSMAFFSAAIAYFFIFSSRTLVDPKLIQTFLSFGNIFLYLGIAYILLVSLKVSNLYQFKNLCYLICFSWIGIDILLSAILFFPAHPLKIDNILYSWEKGGPALFINIEHGLIILGGLAVSFFFLRGAVNCKERITRLRALFIALGTIGISLGAFALLFLVKIFPSITVLAAGSVATFLSWLFLFIGIFYFVPKGKDAPAE